MSTETKKHFGRQISKIRELCGIKQDALAHTMGVSQQTISHMEKCEYIDERKLDEVARALGVKAEAIRNFSEDAVINYFNNFNDNNGNNKNPVNICDYCIFNTFDKLVAAYEEKDILYKKNALLLERLVEAEKRILKAEKDKVVYLEKLLCKEPPSFYSTFSSMLD